MSTAQFNNWKTIYGQPINTIIQSVFATSGSTYQTITSTTPVLLSGMSVSITPKFATSKIVVSAMVTASWTYVCSLHIYKNGVDLIPSHGSNTQTGGDTALFTHYNGPADTSTAGQYNYCAPFPVLFVDTPNTTNAITYDLRANSGWSGGTATFYFNGRGATADMLSSSWMMVQEVRQ